MRRPQHLPMIEPLESRIAPAAVILGAGTSINNPLLYSAKYVSPKTGQVLLQFFNAASSNLSVANKQIADTVHDASNVYFITVSAGETVEIPTAVGYQQLVNVTHGNVVAFFTDVNNDGVVNSNELTGVSLGAKTSAAIGTDVHGDIVTNYNDATQQIGATNATQLLSNTVQSLTVAGNITGDFISGGAVSRFLLTGNVNQILTGNASNAYTFSFAQGVAGTALDVPAPVSGVVGPSLANLNIGSANAITLGAGGPSAAGGSISGLVVQNDSTGISVTAGAGGAGGAVKTFGGAGGSISNVLVEGLPTPVTATPYSAGYSNSLVSLVAGAGGAGAGSAKGGAGGAIQNVYIGYASTSVNNPSLGFQQTDVLLQGGHGGSGGTAGAGGSLSNVNVLAYTFHDPNVTTPEFQLLGGVGGNSTTGGHGGAGGSITNALVEDRALLSFASVTPDDTGTVYATPTSVVVLVQAGAGGNETLKGAGGAGGSVSGLTLEGYNFQVLSGAGGAGVSAGGAGGAIHNVSVLGSSGTLPGDDFHAESVLLSSGAGGSATAGKGGAGGAIGTVQIENADIGTGGLQILTGSGGQAGKGAGGAGGSITNVNVTSADFLTVSFPFGLSGSATISTGNGGSAPVAGGSGGAGGSITEVTVVGDRLAAPNISTGFGGNGGLAGSAGKGGAGGNVTNVSIRTAENLFPSTTTASAGILLDYNQDFGADNVQVGDEVENTLTQVFTTVTSVNGNQLGLASDIFAAYDPYLLVSEQITGYTYDTQDTIIDANANFIAQNIQPGDVVQDDTDIALGDYNTTAVVTQVISATELAVTQDISHVGDQYSFPSLGIATFTAGHGGTGVLTGPGGAGGSIVGTSAVVPGTVTFVGGAGGGGGVSGAAGAGGSLNSDGAFSTFGSGYLTAGNAGTSGGKPGAGGNVNHADVQALADVSLVAGNGATGGAGGSVTSSGYSGVLQTGGTFNPPGGNITVHAGNGGTSLTGNGGAGGAISSVTGFISSGYNSSSYPVLTQFVAGAGGDGVAKAGAGGSVDHVRFFGGGNYGVTLSINAGDAGNASAGKTGVTGGSVTNIGGGTEASGTNDPSFSISQGTNFHNISAGNGGDATVTGGLGGSVSNVYVNAAIGLRTGANFGFDQYGAGGISAGAGGLGATPGLAGNVMNIAADAIASIVAGHLNGGDAFEKANLVTKVSGIILNGTVAPSTVQQFELTYNGVTTTTTLPTNATSLQVASALNSLSSIAAVGGVTVAGGPNGYVVTYNVDGAGTANGQIIADEPAPQYAYDYQDGNATTQAIQGFQVFAQDGFSLTYNGQTTVQLPAGASAADVQAALESLPNFPATGATVQYNPGSPAPNFSNPFYTVTFSHDGAQAQIVPNFAFTEVSSGSSTSQDTEALTFPVRGDLSPAQIGTANFVGSIANLAQPMATTFHFTPGAGLSSTQFQFGDSPVDGLIAAVNLTAYKNFVPEAFVTLDATGTAALLIDPTTT